MKMIPILKKEFEQEAAITRKFLPLVPEEKFGWKPHEKNMTLKELAVHIAEIPAWVDMAFNTDELNFADGYEPTEVKSTEGLMNLFEESVQKGNGALDNADEEDLRKSLTAPAMDESQDLYVSDELRTKRVMVKDEDVCLHCGLCAERCPTNAWDMQRSVVHVPQLGSYKA